MTNSIDGFGISLNGDFNILRTTCASLDFEHSHTSINHLVEEVDGLQVLGRHDVFVLNVELVAGLAVGDSVASAAYLGAGATVGT